jgi:hypothetical protein
MPMYFGVEVKTTLQAFVNSELAEGDLQLSKQTFRSCGYPLYWSVGEPQSKPCRRCCAEENVSLVWKLNHCELVSP